jgi:hypothetical protein
MFIYFQLSRIYSHGNAVGVFDMAVQNKQRANDVAILNPSCDAGKPAVPDDGEIVAAEI